MIVVGKTNRVGKSIDDYKGGPSTLCKGCGHDSITSSIIKACFELGVDSHHLVKLSGIGCSSKTPAYFLKSSHGFNSLHGRMATIATGVAMANKGLKTIGVSGDGDTASIGMGHFVHLIRRNVPMVYIVENNGVYGLTKGQFSATADDGSFLKTGEINNQPPIDLCALAIQLGCQFVGRSFSGDPKQLVPLLEAAMAHNGTAFLDVISPCITFNDHEGSTKSNKYTREHRQPLHDLDFIPYYDETLADYKEGEKFNLRMSDGSVLKLLKLDKDYDPSSKIGALSMLSEMSDTEVVVTGLLYKGLGKKSFQEAENMSDKALSELSIKEIKPGTQALFDFNSGHQ
jgi:2-oxoglutarate ferredoxin oxidoreductase subunit beta